MKAGTFRIVEGLVWLAMVLAAVLLMSCSVNPSQLEPKYTKDFAKKVRCSFGYKDKCWCFVAARKTGNPSTESIGMALAPDELCQ